MKKIVAVIMASIFLASCGQPRILGNKYYPTYGVLNEGASRSKNVCYNVSAGNIIWSILLVETAIFPFYFIGFSLYNPVRLKKSEADDCAFDGAQIDDQSK